MSPADNTVDLRVEQAGDGRILHLGGRLDSRTTGGVWRRLQEALHTPADLVLDASGIRYCDISGVGVLLEIRRRQQAAGRSFRIRGLAEEFQRLLEQFEKAPSEPPDERPKRRVPLPERVGRSTVDAWEDFRNLVIFIGELVANLGRILTRRQKVRWSDTLLIAESVGVRALPIITLMGIVLGLIIAFQGAVPLRRYGGEVLVADMVVLAMFREMGPLFTAIMLAARSASAFAAELGTMKVNEEIDALKTMGLRPVAFLAVPRVAAGIFVAPILTMYMNLCGLIGGGVVFVGLGLHAETYIERIVLRGSAGDLMGGLFRSLIFGVIVAGVGCLQGLQTGTGARAVGESTTRSVVSSIILIIIADGLISVLFFFLGF
jgi:phospholipid/cholesterol/gamma-HCH transport system permease protein